MKSIIMAGYELEIDDNKTLSYYKNLPFIGEEEHCPCMYCKNYALTIAGFPKSVQNQLREMGIDPAKGAEVSHFYQSKNSKHMYVAEYKAFGKLVKKPNEEVIDIYRNNEEDYFSIGFGNTHFNNEEMVFGILIDAFLPWLLEENPE
ncbi:hypothetical protein F9U64_15555 [Gracilibacillus oryzae]|uniref:Uncharacterized protein n=1 Tax=Gracilibacillus oryzae TaxID=1672701 RepID=A0A7C8KR65_9BACI|nr:hypothetical protein [Gracilibacillus oryzae]KAB8129200.1 hypothetical protein F9U64_15555 [Gracilibacillus oryzae]